MSRKFESLIFEIIGIKLFHLKSVCIKKSFGKHCCLSIANELLHSFQGWIQRFRKGVALYVGHHGWSTKKILSFRWPRKAKITLKTILFWQIFLSTFSNFLHFIYNENLPMKSYQFFKICKRCDKERDKSLTR